MTEGAGPSSEAMRPRITGYRGKRTIKVLQVSCRVVASGDEMRNRSEKKCFMICVSKT